MTNDGTGFKLTNEKELHRLFKHLDTSDAKASARIKRVIKAPFNAMRKKARANLKAQGSIKSGALNRGLSTGSSNKKSRQTFFGFFGGRYVKAPAVFKFKTFARTRTKGSYSKLSGTNHFHLVNSGTKIRKNKAGSNRGAVGKSTTNYKNKNTSFKIGFADRAIKSEIPKIEAKYIKGFAKVYETIATENKT